MKTCLFALLAAFILPAHGIVISYNHDAAGRLTGVNYGGASQTTYGYDKNGSLLSRITSDNVLPSLAATYHGLLSNAAAEVGNVGPITLKIATNGSFSGKVTLEGKSYSFKGVFAADGSTADIIFTRKAPLSDLTLSLALDVAGGTRQVTGEITDGDFTSTVALDAAIYSKTQLLPAGLAGSYTTLLLPTDSDPDIPQGNGYATLTVSTFGAIKMAGKLADGAGITHSATLVGAATWPVFISLYKNKGFVTGYVIFASDPGVSDCAGTLGWFKPDTPGVFHPNPIDTELDLLGSKWDAPAKGQRALDFINASPNALFTASEGDLSADLEVDLTLDTANKFIIPAGDPTKLKLTLNAKSGVFLGSFLDGSVTRKLSGVLYQEQNGGSGFFPGSTVSGLVEIEPQP